MDWEKQGNHNENSNSRAVDVTVRLIYQHLLCYDFVELTLDTLIWNYASLQAETNSEQWINWKKMQPDSTGESSTLGNIYFVKQFQSVAMRQTFLVATITRHWMCLHAQSETDYAWANNTFCSICFAFKCINWQCDRQFTYACRCTCWCQTQRELFLHRQLIWTYMLVIKMKERTDKHNMECHKALCWVLCCCSR